jgi:hypothetical protein
VLKRTPHDVEFQHFRVELAKMHLRERLDLPARPPAVLPQAEQFANLFDRESQVTRVADETEGAYFWLCVLTITRFCSRGSGNRPTLS